MMYEFLLDNGLSMILKNPTVVPHSYDDIPVGMHNASNTFVMRLKLTLPCGAEIPYEWRSAILPVSWDEEGVNAWVADRLEEHKI